MYIAPQHLGLCHSHSSNGEQRVHILVPQVTGLTNETRLHMQEYLNLGDSRGLALPSTDKSRRHLSISMDKLGETERDRDARNSVHRRGRRGVRRQEFNNC